MRFLLMLALLFVPAPITLDTTLANNELTFTISTDAPRRFYVEVQTNGGARADATFYQFDLAAGESFGRTITVRSPGTVAIRVWASDGGEGPVVEKTVELPSQRTYIPLIYRA